MNRRNWVWALWTALAALLYFFENGTGTRIVLACSVLLPMVPIIRRSLLGPDENAMHPHTTAYPISALADRETDSPGGVRAYLPGDPVNRIHWKLSAKRDELLVREPAHSRMAAEAEQLAPLKAEQPTVRRHGKPVFLIGFSVVLLSLVLSIAVPTARQGMKALLNRLYDASEAVNAYAYERFAVPADAPVILCAVLLGIMAFSLLGMTILSGSRRMALGLMAGCALFQVYFGLPFPAWVNVPLLAVFVLWMMRRPWRREPVLSALAGVAVLALTVVLVWPGVDAATESSSEAVRDRLSQAAQSVTGVTMEQPAGEKETRHTHTQSLTAGDQEARPDREYRLVTVEEEQISMPHWINYLRIILLLLLTVALVSLPFLPFVLLNRRRKKALDARQAFQSENVSEAVVAIFQHITAWLEATGHGGGNAPYAAWHVDLFPDYAERFAACEKLFEEAAYSTHTMNEEHRQQALALFSETEQALRQRAGWRQRLRLKYRECLWV